VVCFVKPADGNSGISPADETRVSSIFPLSPPLPNITEEAQNKQPMGRNPHLERYNKLSFYGSTSFQKKNKTDVHEN
jgi:hypothetical protein